MKPSWADAPEWAAWLAMDRGGNWCWFQTKPVGKDGVWTYNEFTTTGQMELASRTPLPDYLSTLEERPVHDDDLWNKYEGRLLRLQGDPKSSDWVAQIVEWGGRICVRIDGYAGVDDLRRLANLIEKMSEEASL